MDHRQVISERSEAAILDAAERLLRQRLEPSISAVASEAGVSRPTVYAHFSDRDRLIEALVERTVERTMEAVASADPDEGSADEALNRVLAASWDELGRHEDIARASAAHLGAKALRRAHGSARAVIGELVERGQREGAFRTDMSSGWLVTVCLALIHAAAEEVREGGLDTRAAFDALSSSVADLYRGRPPDSR
jgi:AcrR family transcriptional regulator